MTFAGGPILSDYRVLTGPLPSFGAACARNTICGIGKLSDLKQAAASVGGLFCSVRFWHKADMGFCAAIVRFWG